MRVTLLIWFILTTCTSWCQLTDQEVYDRKGGRLDNDTSFVYTLPYEAGMKQSVD